MQKALVLGGDTGLLGQALARALKERNWDVAVLGRRDGNLLDPEFLRKKLAETSADVVFNTIAWTKVDDAEDHPGDADELNHLFPASLARIMASMDKGHFVHFSTDFVFSGQPATDYWLETDEPAPLNVYGQSKLEGEKAVLANLLGRSCIIRTAWLFGPGRKNFVDTILGLASRENKISVVDDQLGCPTYTPDLAAWSCALAEARETGIWHGVNSGHATWWELAEEAVHLASLPCRVQPIHSSQWPQKARRARNTIMSNAKLGKFLGARPRPWLQALRDYIYSDYLAREDAAQ